MALNSGMRRVQKEDAEMKTMISLIAAMVMSTVALTHNAARAAESGDGSSSDEDKIVLQQLQENAKIELEDYGIAPTSHLHTGSMHGPTPTSLPGARVVTTADLFQFAMSRQKDYLIFDVLGGPRTLPHAISVVPAASPGDFNDPLQQDFGKFLQRTTGGQKDTAMIFYCASTYCWMSYNAVLRAVNLGYRNVMWYRGGLEAWTDVGFPTQAARVRP